MTPAWLFALHMHLVYFRALCFFAVAIEVIFNNAFYELMII